MVSYNSGFFKIFNFMVFSQGTFYILRIKLQEEDAKDSSAYLFVANLMLMIIKYLFLEKALRS